MESRKQKTGKIKTEKEGWREGIDDGKAALVQLFNCSTASVQLFAVG